MWNDLKSRTSAFYQVYVTSERNKDVGIFLKANKAKYGSRSPHGSAGAFAKAGTRQIAPDTLSIFRCEARGVHMRG